MRLKREVQAFFFYCSFSYADITVSAFLHLYNSSFSIFLPFQSFFLFNVSCLLLFSTFSLFNQIFLIRNKSNITPCKCKSFCMPKAFALTGRIVWLYLYPGRCPGQVMSLPLRGALKQSLTYHWYACSSSGMRVLYRRSSDIEPLQSMRVGLLGSVVISL